MGKNKLDELIITITYLGIIAIGVMILLIIIKL